MNEQRVRGAVEKHKQGYNCAQCVVCSYCGEFGFDEREAFIMSEGFGGGMGGMGDGTCGAVTALYMLAGMKHSGGGVENGVTKAATYKAVRELREAFAEKNKSVICRDLKGKGIPGVFRPCDGCIEDAARIAEQMLLPPEQQ